MMKVGLIALVFNSNYEHHIHEYVLNHTMQTCTIGKGKHSEIYNFIPMGFDIETSTQYIKDNKGKVTEHYSNMYVWQFQFDTMTFMGRSWEEFSSLIKVIEKEVCGLFYKTIFFIHNTPFEFQFSAKELLKLGHTMKVFAREKRKPMKWTIDDKIDILDSYLLTHLSLEKLAKNFCTTQKLVNELNYTLLRNQHTILEENEINYCINDVLILKEYAEFYYNTYLVKHQLPLTQTMIANQVIKDSIKNLKCQKEVYALMKKCFPKNKGQYDYIMSFYTGAYTHGFLKNLFKIHAGKGNLAYDVKSEYPYMMLDKYMPMGRFRRLHDLKKIDLFMQNYCCLMEVEFSNIKSKTGVTILSKNKIYDVDGGVYDNGRLYSASKCKARICEIDFLTLSLHYDFDKEFLSCIYCERGKLPAYFRLGIAQLFDDKEKLNGVEGMEKEYLCTKQKLNGQYGSCCTKLNFTEVIFDETGAWIEPTKEIDFDDIIRYKNKLPQWAIYITSWSRYHILSSVKEIIDINKNCYLYSDTDSIKCKYSEPVKDYFRKLNAKIIENNKNGFMKELGLTGRHYELIGTWELEHDEKEFKKFVSLGSKRYLCEYEKKGKRVVETTVAGLPKNAFIDYCDKNGLDYFETFNTKHLMLSEEDSTKLGSFYQDNETTFDVVDYQGNKETVTSQSYVSLIPITFNLEVKGELSKLFNQLYNL